MGYLSSIQAKTIPIDGNSNIIPKSLIHALVEFTKQHYDFEQNSFIEQILQPQQIGQLILFYNKAKEIAGYTRVHQVHIQNGENTVLICSAYSCNNPIYNLNFASARLCLTEIMKYKLVHPEKELVCISCITSPEKYLFLSRLHRNISPKPQVLVPETTLKLIHELKRCYHWSSCAEHPMLISGLPRAKHPSITRLDENPLIEYYLSLNPDYSAGKGLLVYMPFNIGSISDSLKHLITRQGLDLGQQLMNLNHLPNVSA
ncbi:hypothetical protein [Legionella oakridgensis]|uniref:hypothetical protein n=1 Tax=Legionella oakridgensis TaxID=29423 RepID=UPI0003DE4DF7|nr:hypothetical protein [Legionella oakridgensis]ETO92252.1 hypothetical protein LOR_104c25890 [Legionella oakridgensis RV-2-2007]